MSYILLVDDDDDMLMLVSRWLQKAAYEVTAVNSGAAAITEISRKIPDLILLDYGMPEMDGPATLKAIREMESGKTIPVLFRTGKDDLSAWENMEMLKPFDVISKAEGKALLLSKIETILQ
ncbi:response regulator [Butyrivibrio sp. AC2005]|uniref:response regulator n=1 Tax=Butyrivibrio sp. AC2005 TaxID=1280672 RepID=UPI00040E88EA|nr:response regulator [Butyrivibrio sp. AC2005]